MFNKTRLFILSLLVFLLAGYSLCSALPAPAGSLSRAQAIEKLFSNRELDVVEGIWTTANGVYEIAITKNKYDLEKYKQYDYVGLVIHNTTGVWKAGELKLAIKKTAAERALVGIWYGYGPFGSSSQGEATYLVRERNVIECYFPNFSPARDFLIRVYPDKSTPAAKQQIAATGTGFFVTKNIVVTNNHVIEGMSQIQVYLGERKAAATVIGRDAANDVALLKVNGLEEAVAPLSLGNAKGVKQGNKVYAYGFPVPGLMGTNPKLTDGIISSLTGYKDDVRVFQISVPIQPGNSGGPLIDERGRVIGITSAVAGMGFINYTGVTPQNISYAMKSTVVFNLIANLPEEISLEHPREDAPVLSAEQVVDIARKAVVFISVTNQ